jgi:hypothetical protein
MTVKSQSGDAGFVASLAEAFAWDGTAAIRDASTGADAARGALHAVERSAKVAHGTRVATWNESDRIGPREWVKPFIVGLLSVG